MTWLLFIDERKRLAHAPRVNALAVCFCVLLCAARAATLMRPRKDALLRRRCLHSPSMKYPEKIFLIFSRHAQCLPRGVDSQRLRSNLSKLLKDFYMQQPFVNCVSLSRTANCAPLTWVAEEMAESVEFCFGI